MGQYQSEDSFSFEQALEKLQTAVRSLESGELSLEDSLKQFEEGVRLTRKCQEYLKGAEQHVEMLLKAGNSENGDPILTQNFDVDSGSPVGPRRT